MKSRWRTLVLCPAIPLLGGVVSGLVSMPGMEAFERVKQPPLSPPGWLFPVVWTFLYALMGLASWLVVRADADADSQTRALRAYGLQLAVNLLWSPIFFLEGAYLLSFLWLVLLWVLLLVTLLRFAAIDRTAGLLLVPYLLWVTFAGYLNLGVYLLN